MNYNVTLLEKQDKLGVLILNRPEVLNAWNDEMVEDALKALREISDDQEIRVLIITGAGKAFSAGADVKEWFGEILDGKRVFPDTVVGHRLQGMPNVLEVVQAIATLGKPVIAAINGAAAGIGLSIALACDIRMASEQARFLIGYTDVGLIPDGGATSALPRLIGIGKANKFVFSGDTVDAREAERISMVDDVVAPEQLMDKARELGQKIAEKPPLAIKMAKQAMRKGFNEPDLSSQMDYEIYIQQALFQTEDFKDRVKAFLKRS